MKVLLLGDYSAFHKYLKDGLEELGVDVTLISTGDAFKKIENDINIGSSRKGFKGLLESAIRPLIYLPKMLNYDVVQLINPRIFPIKFGYSKLILSTIFKMADKSFLCACGDDAYYWKAKNAFRYSPHQGHYEDLNGKENWWETEAAIELNDWVVDHVDGIIPTSYFYYFANKNNHKNVRFIPLPVNYDEIRYEENVVKEKIIFFHGLNREGVKGTKYIRKAFDIISHKYPQMVETIIEGKMPLKDYKKCLRRANVIVDQTSGFGPAGMNALISMAMGKVIMGGYESESLDLMGIDKSPVVNITPSVEDIVEKMEAIIKKDKNDIFEWGRKSRKYVEQHHSYIDVAQRMISFWNCT